MGCLKFGEHRIYTLILLFFSDKVLPNVCGEGTSLKIHLTFQTVMLFKIFHARSKIDLRSMERDFWISKMLSPVDLSTPLPSLVNLIRRTLPNMDQYSTLSLCFDCAFNWFNLIPQPLAVPLEQHLFGSFSQCHWLRKWLLGSLADFSGRNCKNDDPHNTH